jgi:hypothetical protein
MVVTTGAVQGLPTNNKMRSTAVVAWSLAVLMLTGLGIIFSRWRTILPRAARPAGRHPGATGPGLGDDGTGGGCA